MKKQTTQWALSAVAIAMAGMVMTQSYNTAEAQTDTSGFVTTPAQKKTTRQVAALLDRSHYLNQKLNDEMSRKILDMFFDDLDSNHTLFLQSDIREFTEKYGDEFDNYLKRGDLSAGAEIYKRYHQRKNEYYDFAKAMLSAEINLNTNEAVILDREKLPRFDTQIQQHDFWRRQITSQVINITLSQEGEKAKEKVLLENPEIARGQDLIRDDKRSPKEILLKRLNRVQGQMNRIKDDEIMEAILNTAALTYDPHSNYYAPIQATEREIESNLELEGIGVSIRPDRKNPDYTRIITLVDAGPAEKSGQIKPNDLIIGVAKDGKEMQDVVGWSTREVVGLIRGKRGTTVTIKVKQPNTPDSSARTVNIVRDIIKQEESGVQHRVVEVEHHGVKKRIGVMEIPSFYLNFKARRDGAEDYRSVSNDTEKALKALNKEGIDSLVVDLRNNPGGSLDEVAKMLSFFIKEGPVVQIRDGQGDVEVLSDDEDGGEELYSGDMSVLINLGSASASEIFAAAIQDYGRGLIIGSTTTGKGSAQVQLGSLELGMMTLTQRKFYRITGGSTQNKGVIPDVNLVNIYDSGEAQGERALENPLEWDTIKTAAYKPEGKYSQATLKTLNQLSQLRQKIEPQFVYLSTLNNIRKLDDDKEPVAVNIDKRRQHMKEIEAKTLATENTRRIANGDKPYSNWNVYLAEQDAKFEERSMMKENERPPLPEDEAFIVESAKIMLDVNGQNKGKH